MQFRDDVAELLTKNQRLRTAVGEDESEFVGNQTPVEWHDDSTDTRHGKKRFNKLGTVHQQQTDPVTLTDARCQQRIGLAVASLGKRCIVEPQVAAAVYKRFPRGIQVCALLKQRSDVLLHELLPRKLAPR